jgi:uncharacterized membrane protein
MIIHHIFFFYDQTFNTNISNNNLISTIGTISRNLFLLIVGMIISYTYNISNNKKKYIINRIFRCGIILFNALLISFITYIYYPDKFIRFGILHFIGIITLILSLLYYIITPLQINIKNFKISILPYILLIISIILKYTKINPINPFIDTILGTNYYYNMLDYFPIIKWLPIIIIGIIIGDINNNYLIFKNKFKENIITWIGQNSLLFYTIHMYILIIIYNIIKYLIQK